MLPLSPAIPSTFTLYVPNWLMGTVASAVPSSPALAENKPSPITPGPVTVPVTNSPGGRLVILTMTSLSEPGIL